MSFGNYSFRFIKKRKIKLYNKLKEYGFNARESSDDLFVYRSGLYSSYVGLDAEQKVGFDIRPGDNGMVAYNVKSSN